MAFTIEERNRALQWAMKNIITDNYDYYVDVRMWDQVSSVLGIEPNYENPIVHAVFTESNPDYLKIPVLSNDIAFKRTWAYIFSDGYRLDHVLSEPYTEDRLGFNSRGTSKLVDDKYMETVVNLPDMSDAIIRESYIKNGSKYEFSYRSIEAYDPPTKEIVWSSFIYEDYWRLGFPEATDIEKWFRSYYTRSTS